MPFHTVYATDACEVRRYGDEANPHYRVNVGPKPEPIANAKNEKTRELIVVQEDEDLPEGHVWWNDSVLIGAARRLAQFDAENVLPGNADSDVNVPAWVERRKELAGALEHARKVKTVTDWHTSCVIPPGVPTEALAALLADRRSEGGE